MATTTSCWSLNEVRPGRPEQFGARWRELETAAGLNEVRPGRPEQFRGGTYGRSGAGLVSMKSGLEDRNNLSIPALLIYSTLSLNEVRPGRPEQWIQHDGDLSRIEESQ